MICENVYVDICSIRDIIYVYATNVAYRRNPYLILGKDIVIIMKKKTSGAYYDLEETDNFQSGYLLVDETLYLFDKDGHVQDEYDVCGKRIEEKVSDGRRQAGIDGRTHVYVDTCGIYDSDIIDDYGRLITADEAFDELSPEEQDDYESFAEYCSGL